METVTLVATLSWGGSDPREDLDHVMAKIKCGVPSAKFARVDGVTSGGWPVFEITVTSDEAWDLCDLLGYDYDEVL